MNRNKIFVAIAGLMLAADAAAQEGFHVSGSVQSDMLVPTKSFIDNGKEVNNDFLTNTYVDVMLTGKHLDMGFRGEYMEQPLPGFEQEFKGWGVPHFYGKLHDEKWELTFGTFYEQFGSGFILRTYEERSLGIDNSIAGARLKVQPVDGVSITALTGKQRNYWEWNAGLVSGADVELSLDRWIKPLANSGTYLTIGASWVNKNQDDQEQIVDVTHRLNFPRNVNAFDFRARLQKGAWNILAEYAVKGQDPNYDNNYIYKQGEVAMLSASYSKKGLSALVQAKRSDNMSFRSNRMQNGTALFINHLPAFTMQHTYALAALYPYATHPDGEWAYQAELGYRFKKNTLIGGKYGTALKLNYSYIRSLNTTPVDGGGSGTDGYKSSFFKWGDQTYYQDLNVQVEKKLSKSTKLDLMYMNQRYNKTIVEGEGGMIHSDIVVVDVKHQIDKKTTVRAEAQYLSTKDDEGDWAYGMVELSLAPKWMFTVADLYNVGETNIHYYQGSVAYNLNSHRIQLGFGRTRAGLNCSGGVCRYIPATKGFTIAYNYSF